ncbi:hypothetical protein HY991_04910 [Candidatus Micrarchaeota archaeon]|nr:hypothetical protein [Candidatus Micrarchaeota archaeon]
MRLLCILPVLFLSAFACAGVPAINLSYGGSSEGVVTLFATFFHNNSKQDYVDLIEVTQGDTTVFRKTFSSSNYSNDSEMRFSFSVPVLALPLLAFKARSTAYGTAEASFNSSEILPYLPMKANETSTTLAKRIPRTPTVYNATVPSANPSLPVYSNYLFLAGAGLLILVSIVFVYKRFKTRN